MLVAQLKDGIMESTKENAIAALSTTSNTSAHKSIKDWVELDTVLSNLLLTCQLQRSQAQTADVDEKLAILDEISLSAVEGEFDRAM